MLDAYEDDPWQGGPDDPIPFEPKQYCGRCGAPGARFVGLVGYPLCIECEYDAKEFDN